MPGDEEDFVRDLGASHSVDYTDDVVNVSNVVGLVSLLSRERPS
jgi:hypothetical protein